MRFVALIAVELHWPVFRPVDLNRTLDCFFVGLEMGDIECRVSQKFLALFLGTMAEETLLHPWFEVLCSVRMTVEACKLLHPGSVHFLVLVARQTVSFLKAELMGPVAVTFCAFDLFHKDMLCVVPRTADVRCIRGFFVLFPMTGKTCLPRHDYFTVPG